MLRLNQILRGNDEITDDNKWMQSIQLTFVLHSSELILTFNYYDFHLRQYDFKQNKIVIERYRYISERNIV